MATIFITGASGYIGQFIAKDLKEKGHAVVGISRSPCPVPGTLHIKAGLGESISTALHQYKPDLIIHAANSTSKNQLHENIEGTLLWMKEAESLDQNPIQVYFGSVSGNEFNTTEYGQAKFIVEKAFLERSHLVLKLGLVIGRGGFFWKIFEMAKKRLFLPLLDGGKDPVYWTDLDWIKISINQIISKKDLNLKSGMILLLSKKPSSIKEMVEIISKIHDKKTFYIDVPSITLYYFARFFEILGIKLLPFSSGSILSSKQNSRKEWGTSLQVFGIQEINIKDSIRKSL